MNTLSNDELKHWDDFLERWGFWEGRIEDSVSERFDFLKRKCSSENRAIVVSAFRTSRLSNKIREMVTYFLNQNKDHSRAFIAALVNALCQKHVDWERIVSWLELDENSFKIAVRSSPVFDFMSGSRKWYQFTSAELADFIISNYDFPLEEVVDVYTTIVRQTAYSSNDLRSGFDSRENLKELMRYRFLTRLLARVANGAKTINAVYQRLSVVQRIRDNDQFWLQFAMARMEEDDLDTASTYLNTAMGIAEKKGQDYSKRQLTDQRARLRFRKNARSGTVINKKELAEAISDLNGEVVKKTEYLVHPLRSVEHILHFLEMRIDDLDEDVIGLLRSLIKTMREHFPDGKLDKSQRGETEKIRKDLQSSWLILANA